MMHFEPLLLWRAAVHEAGHIVADHLHGFFPIETSLDITDQGVGSGRTDCRDRQAIVSTAEKYIISCLAGPEAEKSLIADDELAEVGSMSDHAKAMQVLRAWPRHDLSFYSARAREVVTEAANANAIKNLALELANEKSLIGMELQLAIAAAYQLEGSGRALSTLRENGAHASLAVLRTQASVRLTAVNPAQFLSDSLVLGDFSLLQSNEPVDVRPQNADDLERLVRLSGQGSIVLEMLDGSNDVISLERVVVTGDRITLEPYQFWP